jgi:DNA-binding protein HU-beta
MEEFKMPNDVVNKKVLADEVAEKAGLTKKAAGEVVELVFESIRLNVKEGHKVDIAGFGKFEQRARKSREGFNPKTKEKIKIKASKSVAFKASKAFKELVK